jgi:hypothetical protein
MRLVEAADSVQMEQKSVNIRAVYVLLLWLRYLLVSSGEETDNEEALAWSGIQHFPFGDILIAHELGKEVILVSLLVPVSLTKHLQYLAKVGIP